MIIYCWILPRMRRVPDKSFTEIKTHILYSVTSLSENRPFYDIMWKIWYSQSDHKWQYNTAQALCELENYGYNHTIRICNTYCSCTSTTLSRWCLSVTLTRILHALFWFWRSSLPSSEPGNSSILEEIPHLSRNPKIYSCVKDKSVVETCVNFSYYSLRLFSKFNNIFLSKHRSPKQTTPFTLSDQNVLNILVLSTSAYRPVHLPHLSLIYLYNIWWRTKHNGLLYSQSIARNIDKTKWPPLFICWFTLRKNKSRPLMDSFLWNSVWISGSWVYLIFVALAVFDCSAWHLC